MKNLILILSLMVPFTGQATERVPLTGKYSECVRWTTYNGVETSKKFELVLAEDRSISLSIGFYWGSAECESAPKELTTLNRFEMLEDFDTGLGFRKMKAKEADSNVYYEFLVTKENAMVYSGDSLPVKPDFLRTLSLTRDQ